MRPYWDSNRMDGATHVLLVDDDPAHTDLSSTFLERIDGSLETHTETSPADAIDYVHERDDVDCVVSDYNMPEMDGLELFENISAIDELPFILFTGRGSEEIASEAISRGVTDYLQKAGGSDQYEVLANRIQNVVGQYDARREAAETSEQLAQVIDRISDAFFAVDPDWTIEFVNERAAEFIGEPPSDLVGTDLRDSVPEDEAAGFYEVYRRALHTQEPITYEGESALRPGTYVENRVFPAEDGLSVYFRDVTDRVRIESELQEANQKITALNGVATAVGECDTADEIFDLAIEAAEDILEFDRCAIDEADNSHLVPQAVSEGFVSDGVYLKTPIDAADSLGAETYRTGESYLVGNPSEKKCVSADRGYTSVLSVPVGDHGVFQAVSTNVDAFTDRDRELAEILLSHVAVALGRVSASDSRVQ